VTTLILFMVNPLIPIHMPLYLTPSTLMLPRVFPEIRTTQHWTD